jgi:hypothetical protein
MARKTKYKKPHFRIAIVGEGETEWYYFTHMKLYEKFSFKIEPSLPKHSDFKTIIKTARTKRDQGYDLVFCVLDLDRILTNSTEKKGYFREKSKKVPNKGIVFIESMPCIELWFYLHFLKTYSNKIYQNYNEIKSELIKHIQYYDKTESFLKKINLYELLIKKGDYRLANSFATKMNEEKKKSDNEIFNFTKINELISQIKSIDK